jgi:hypothetical protein
LLDLRKEARPLLAEAPAAGSTSVAHEKYARARLAISEIPAWPMFVRNDVRGADAIPIREGGSQAGGTIERRSLACTIAELANLDADAGPVARSAVIRMVALFGREKVLHDLAIVDRVMPGYPSRSAESGIVFAEW